ncbi:response regulator [Candidatus Parcubacteria bacterium]|nr:MAG: response regulator [Candidatus Parcubacteria bacterium]
MSPEEARIFLAEDDPGWAELNRLGVTIAGHHVVIEVRDVNEGLNLVQEAQQLGVNVALLDGRIPFGPDDGTKLAAALREAIPSMQVVDISISGDAVKGANAQMPKDRFDIGELGELVTDL